MKRTFATLVAAGLCAGGVGVHAVKTTIPAKQQHAVALSTEQHQHHAGHERADASPPQPLHFHKEAPAAPAGSAPTMLALLQTSLNRLDKHLAGSAHMLRHVGAAIGAVNLSVDEHGEKSGEHSTSGSEKTENPYDGLGPHGPGDEYTVYGGAIRAFGWGFLSAVSLLIGALIGVTCPPSTQVNAACMAFGAGALLEALSIELFGHIIHMAAHGDGGDSNRDGIRGGVGDTRKAGAYNGEVGDGVGQGPTINDADLSLPFNDPEHIRATTAAVRDYPTLPMIAIVSAIAGGVFFSWLEKALNDKGAASRKVATARQHLDKLKRQGTDLDLADLELEAALEKENEHPSAADDDLAVTKSRALARKESTGDKVDEHARMKAIVIWLGILLDGIPESIVLGIQSNNATFSSLLTFVVAVFLANLPEAMSASAVMFRNKMARMQIMGMWAVITVCTGVGAGIGSILFPPGSQKNVETLRYIAMIEGACGGAMLTMIANTVLPEAFHMGGNVVGLSCLGGFLAAMSVTVFSGVEEH